jgi:hypothetical protein
MKMKMENKHDDKLEDELYSKIVEITKVKSNQNKRSPEDEDEDIGEDIDTVTGLDWGDDEVKFAKEEERKQDKERKSKKSKQFGGKSKRTRKSKKSKRTRKSKKSKK